jgi:formylglycine-generating enzyme required for sulfatase activity
MVDPWEGIMKAPKIAYLIIALAWIVLTAAVPAHSTPYTLSQTFNDPTVTSGDGFGVKPGDIFWDCYVCPKLVVVPAGVFDMGAQYAEGGDDEMPIHRVRIWHNFAIGRYEVTRSEFKAFVSATGYRIDGPCRYLDLEKSDWEESDLANYGNSWFPQNDDHPAVCVNWHDAKAYVAWLTGVTGKLYRLPSEAEWEYAARGGASTRYHFGTSYGDICIYGNGSDADFPFKWRNDDCVDGYPWGTARAGSYRPNAFGLYDTIGNAKEWLEDCWNDSYDGAPVDGTPWITGQCRSRVIRGGSWLNDPRYLRSAARLRTYAGYRKYDHGFRVVRSLTQ